MGLSCLDAVLRRENFVFVNTAMEIYQSDSAAQVLRRHGQADAQRRRLRISILSGALVD